ncbi:hypothetical protein SAMN04488023_13526 [Pedobacter rhizosphaerae]|uniref:Uncharacterized protein n=1 Tax=Pedobacter rhizosphaerae TaxID=390241 RepID=A0A1H9UYJ6_9SPHI|nr:hypothetical protein SAMN04488023_13526 [Pedobacter rhizosphaerae]
MRISSPLLHLIIWLLLVALSIIVKLFDIKIYYVASLLPLILITYVVKKEKFEFFKRSKFLTMLIFGISFFMFFFSVENLLGFINEPYRRVVLITLLFAYSFLIKTILGKHCKPNSN